MSKITWDNLDSKGLNDYQKKVSSSNIPVAQVGITRFRFPIFLEEGNEIIRHDAQASISVNLAPHKTGINMSRLCSVAQKVLQKPLSPQLLNDLMDQLNSELKDDPQDNDFESIQFKLDFNYTLKQQSLSSKNWGWQYYPVTIKINQNKEVFYQVAYEYSSTCPCSLSMAKQYEDSFSKGETKVGSGIATAHSQRSCATVLIQTELNSNFTLENLIYLCREAIVTETQSLVKRIDEQAFAILNGENPLFVEDAARLLTLKLNEEDRISDWWATVEHFESLHSHNAAAYFYKNEPKYLNLSLF